MRYSKVIEAILLLTVVFLIGTLSLMGTLDVNTFGGILCICVGVLGAGVVVLYSQLNDEAENDKDLMHLKENK